MIRKIESSGRYGEKPWFHLGFSDGQRFGQNLFFSYLSDEKRATEPTKNWHSEIVQVGKNNIYVFNFICQYHYGKRQFLADELGRTTDEYCEPGWQCGHYTAVVWSTTRYVGCGYHVCQG